MGAKLKSSTLMSETARTVSREMYTSLDGHAVDLRAISYQVYAILWMNFPNISLAKEKIEKPDRKML